MPKLISFDIDGTMEFGEPAGVITLEMVRKARSLGYLIGSCSDRTVGNQQRLWQEHQIPVDFTVLKHRLNDVKAQFQADEYYHIGDSELDEFYSGISGFRFLPADSSAPRVLGLDPPA